MKFTIINWIVFAIVLTASISCENGLNWERMVRGRDFSKPTGQIDEVPLSRAEVGFVEAGNDFAWVLARKVWAAQDNKGSFLISPLSLQYALGMAGNGAEGPVADQLAQTLGYGGTVAVNGFCNKLITHLPLVDTTITLTLANALLANDIYPLNMEMAATLEEVYDASVESMPFFNPQAVLERVNGWCREHTCGRIDKVLDLVLPDAALYLMNAIYFNGNWTFPFSVANTKTQKFLTLSGNRVDVDMMHQNLRGSCEETQSYQKISLPYGRGKYLMNVILPKKGVDIASLMGDMLSLPASGMARDVILSLPKFDSELFKDLAPILFDMGVPDGPYDKMLVPGTTGNPIIISRIPHKARLTVNEAGTEASAVTIIEFCAMGMGPNTPQPPVEFTADHTFLYTITEATSGVVLFVGVYDGD